MNQPTQPLSDLFPKEAAELETFLTTLNETIDDFARCHADGKDAAIAFCASLRNSVSSNFQMYGQTLVTIHTYKDHLLPSEVAPKNVKKSN